MSKDKRFLLFGYVFLLVFLWSWNPGVETIKAEPLDAGNPFDFKADTCLCSDMKKLNGDLVGKACMCDSKEEWPGKVLVFFLTPEGLDVMRFKLNQLSEDFNAKRLRERWGIIIHE